MPRKLGLAKARPKKKKVVLIAEEPEETFDVTLNKTGPSPLDPDVTVVGFTIEGELDRTAYGVDYFAPAVAATMPVRIDLEASPAK